ncbi:MAG: hypothetical protein R2854_19265 [Caldilineaceae bacterium]
MRYSSFITPALCTLMGLGLAGLGRVWRPLTIVGMVVVLLGLAPTVRADLFDPSAAREDMTGLTDWLKANAHEGDIIFVDQKYPFGFYYKRYAIGEETTPTGPEAASARYLFVDINTIDAKLNQWASERQVFWVQWFESDTDPRHAVSFLLDKAGTRAGEKAFRGYSVDWWQLTPPTEFELAQRYTPLDVRFEPGVAAVELALPDTPVAPGEMVFAVLRWARTTGAADRPLKARGPLRGRRQPRRQVTSAFSTTAISCPASGATTTARSTSTAWPRRPISPGNLRRQPARLRCRHPDPVRFPRRSRQPGGSRENDWGSGNRRLRDWGDWRLGRLRDGD